MMIATVIKRRPKRAEGKDAGTREAERLGGTWKSTEDAVGAQPLPCAASPGSSCEGPDVGGFVANPAALGMEGWIWSQVVLGLTWAAQGSIPGRTMGHTPADNYGGLHSTWVQSEGQTEASCGGGP